MAYSQQVWNNGPNSGTPLNATRLNKMESGIAGAATAADNANSALGTKASTADLGNTNDALAALRTAAFGGPNRTKPFMGRCHFTGSNVSLQGGTDWAAYGGWAVDTSVDSGDNMVYVDATAGAWCIGAPVTGKYLITHSSRFVSSIANQYLNACCVKNTIAAGSRAANLLTVSEWNVPAATQRCTPSNSKVVSLVAGDKVFMTQGSTSGAFTVIGNEVPLANTFWSLLWVGP